MDKKSLLGLVLIFFVLLGWSFWQSKKMQKQREEMAAQAALEMAERVAMAGTDTLPMTTVNQDASQTSSMQAPTVDASHPFALAMQAGAAEHFQVENDVFTVDFNTMGGRIAGITLKDYLKWDKRDSTQSRDLTLMDETRSDFYLQFFSQNRLIRTDNCLFECLMPEKTHVEAGDSAVVRMRLYPNVLSADGSNELTYDKERYIEYVYTVRGGEYMMGFDINFVNTNTIIPSNTNFIDLVWKARLERYEKSLKMEGMNTAVYYNPTTEKVRYLKETRDDAKTLTTPTKWISFKQQFFNVCLIADKDFSSADIKNYTRREAPCADYLKDLEATIGIPYDGGEHQSMGMQLYAGPNKYRTLRDYHLGMERVIPLGWSFFLMQWINRFAVIPVFDWLEKSGMGYGLIILLLTIMLKIVIFPFTFKSYKSSAKMRVLQPQMAEINAKYPKPEQNMEKQQATMALYKKAGVSPMSGCLPMLFQFPILVAMFRFFPASIELRQQPFLWAEDLSSYDSICNFGFNIPFYGDHVSLFALMMALTNLAYTMMTMRQQQSNNAMPGMKFMMYAMPIIFLGAFNSYSCGLNYYYVISTLITFLQMWLIRKFLVDDEKVLAEIKANQNKKSTKKKSRFQLRLEEMARQQQELARQQQKEREKRQGRR